MSEPTIMLHQENAVASLTINRPQVKNALDQASWELLTETLDRVAADTSIRALLVRGSGGNFCAGADISEFIALAESPERLRSNNASVQQAQEKLEELPIPTIAVIEGACVGGGCGLALACDFRLATTDAALAITPAKLGLVYSYRDTRRLVAAVGAPFAKDMLYSGRRVDAAEALSRGLLTQLFDTAELHPEALRMAQRLAASSRYSLRGMKQVIASVEGYGTLEREQIQALFDAAFGAADFNEGVDAFLNKRKPRFD